MENRTINIAVVEEVALALKELKDEMVFVGGAVVSFYTDDPAADEIRPTADIDMTVKLMNFSSWVKMQERLQELGFNPDPFGHAICSYKYKNILIDIMPSEDSSFGDSNRWYKIGFENLQTVKAINTDIQILPAPCYLATKFEAFNDRGKDYRTSHDFEDIINILDNRTTIIEEIRYSPDKVKQYLKDEINKLINQPASEEYISAHIHPLMLEERYPILVERLSIIVIM